MASETGRPAPAPGAPPRGRGGWRPPAPAASTATAATAARGTRPPEGGFVPGRCPPPAAAGPSSFLICTAPRARMPRTPPLPPHLSTSFRYVPPLSQALRPPPSAPPAPISGTRPTWTCSGGRPPPPPRPCRASPPPPPRPRNGASRSRWCRWHDGGRQRPPRDPTSTAAAAADVAATATTTTAAADAAANRAAHPYSSLDVTAARWSGCASRESQVGSREAGPT